MLLRQAVRWWPGQLLLPPLPDEIAARAAVVGLVQTADGTIRAEPFVVDRPFLYYIVDDATGAILFQGRISDPRPPS